MSSSSGAERSSARDTVTARTLLPAQGGPVAQPDDAVGPDLRTRKIVAGADPIDGVALFVARDGDDHQAGTRDRGKGERQTRLRVRVVAGRHYEPLGLRQR